jgi:hypothetical protein
MGANLKVFLVAVWLAFLSRGLFYCVEQPMWEGYDEWAHFAYVQHIAEHRTLPSRTDPVSYEVGRSLQLVPLSRSAAAIGPVTITHDLFWQLAPEERRRRELDVRRLSSSATEAGDSSARATQYEAQQPPLYYLVLAPAYLMLKRASLPAQVLVLRIVSVVIASSVVLFGYAIARRVIRSRTASLLVAVLLACLPGLYVNVCRIGNESLSIALTSAVILCSLRACRRQSGTLDSLLLGMVMGAALLTKAYTVAFLPLIAVMALIRTLRHPHAWKQTVACCGIAYAAAIAIGGWWYWRTWVTTGTLSGEQLDIAAKKFSFAEKLAAVSRMDWRAVGDAAAFSHIWLGGWSFLVVRSWMYRVCEYVAVLAAFGLLVYLIRTVRSARQGRILRALGSPSAVLVTAYVLMCFAVAYHSLVAFLAQKISTALGWYLYSVIVPEMVLLALGLTGLFGKKWPPVALASVCVLAVALDLYTVHFLLLPYYAGMIGHNPSGTLESFHVETLVSQMDVLFQRLSINRPALVGPAVVAAMWTAYVCSTLALGAIAIFVASARRTRISS